MYCVWKIFTESVPRLIQSISHNVRGCVVCHLSVPSVSYRKQMSWRLLVKEPIAKIAKLRTPPIFGRLQPFRFWIYFSFFLSWWTRLLCIVGELAGGWSVVVGVGYRRHVTCDRGQVTGDRWQMTWYTWQMTQNINFICWGAQICFIFFVSVLLSAHIGIGSTVLGCNTCL